MLIQNSATNGAIELINAHNILDLYITFINVLFKLNQVMLNNMDTPNMVTIMNVSNH